MATTVRLISSAQHDVSKQELIDVIRKTGTDKYDPNRQKIFDDYYKSFVIDFFGSKTQDVEKDLAQLQKEFMQKTLGDRGESVSADIAILYKESSCTMVQHVYPGQEQSDCYVFKSDPKDALIEVREI